MFVHSVYMHTSLSQSSSLNSFCSWRTCRFQQQCEISNNHTEVANVVVSNQLLEQRASHTCRVCSDAVKCCLLTLRCVTQTHHLNKLHTNIQWDLPLFWRLIIEAHTYQHNVSYFMQNTWTSSINASYLCTLRFCAAHYSTVDPTSIMIKVQCVAQYKHFRPSIFHILTIEK